MQSELICCRYETCCVWMLGFSNWLLYSTALNQALDFTLQQQFLVPRDLHCNGQVSGGVVGGATVEMIPSARCLHMYFCWVEQLITSHRPASIPVVMATQPWFLSFSKHTSPRTKRKSRLGGSLMKSLETQKPRLIDVIVQSGRTEVHRVDFATARS